MATRGGLESAKVAATRKKAMAEGLAKRAQFEGKGLVPTGPAAKPPARAAVKVAAARPAKAVVTSTAPAKSLRPAPKPKPSRRKRSDGAGRDRFGQWVGPGGRDD